MKTLSLMVLDIFKLSVFMLLSFILYRITNKCIRQSGIMQNAVMLSVMAPSSHGDRFGSIYVFLNYDHLIGFSFSPSI
jgi:hypothetical protein